MSNMAYCRFQNTWHDLEDCYRHLHDRLDADGCELQPSEQYARKQLIELCRKIAEETEE